MQTVIDDLTNEIQELRSIVAAKDEALGQQLANVEQNKTVYDNSKKKMQMEIDNLTNKIQELGSIVAAKDEALGQNLAIANQIKTERDNSMNTMQTVIDDLTNEIQELRSLVAAKDEACDQHLALVDQIKTERDNKRTVMQMEIDNLANEIQELRSIVAAKDEALDQHITIVDQIKTELDDSRSEMQMYIDDLANEIQELRSMVAAKDEALGQQLANVDQNKTVFDNSINTMQMDIDDLTNEIKELRSIVAAKDEALDRQLAIADQIKTERDNSRSEMQMEIDNLTYEIQELRSIVAAKDNAIVESSSKADELLKQLGRVESVEDLRLQRDNSNAEVSQLRRTIALKDDEILQLNQNITFLREGQAKIETASQDLALTCNEASSQKASLQSEISAILASRQEMQQELDVLKVSLSSISTERDLLLRKVESAENVARTEQGTIDIATSELSETISALENEKYELTQLLAAANASVREAREAAFAADEELDLKERKLEEVLSLLSQREEELISRTEQVVDLKRQLEGSEPSEKGLLFDTIKALQEEKVQLEDLVASAAKERDVLEQEHRKRMGEEQRLLIREAEGEMTNLRTVRDQLKSALTQSETALFALQQENERLVEEKKRLESKSHECKRNIPLLESEVSRLKSVNLDLTIENKDLASKVLILRKENGSQDHKANEEVVKLTTEVNRLKTESYAARQRTVELQEAVRVSERRSQTYLDESQCERQRRQEIESTVLILQAEIEKLRQSMLKKEDAVDADISRKLQEVEDLKKEIVSRDARIKKLEAVRLTKEQCAVLKKIKVCSSEIH
jgi:chromosome segregation ATPase